MALLALPSVSVADLRKSGLRVFVLHKRYYVASTDRGETQVVGPFTRREAENYGFQGVDTFARGGYTLVEIYKDDELVTQGWADCSIKDAFVRRTGLQYALARALMTLGLKMLADERVLND